jgi:large subunit ribosomal protein L32
LSICPQCKAAKLPHRTCLACGTYKGKEVIDLSSAQA